MYLRNAIYLLFDSKLFPITSFFLNHLLSFWHIDTMHYRITVEGRQNSKKALPPPQKDGVMKGRKSGIPLKIHFIMIGKFRARSNKSFGTSFD